MALTENRILMKVEVVSPEKIAIRHLSEPKLTLTIVVAPSENGSVVNWLQEFENEQVAKNIAHILEPAMSKTLIGSRQQPAAASKSLKHAPSRARSPNNYDRELMQLIKSVR